MIRFRSVPVLSVLLGVTLLSLAAEAIAWSESKAVTRRNVTVVTYRAAFAGEMLVVEATHADGWHTYAMDNVERAKRKTGKEAPETELPTSITVSGGLEVAGTWLQTEPTDLSDPEIFWHTWGFGGVVYFAVPAKRVAGKNEATVTINGQACDAKVCSMVDGVTLQVSLEGESSESFDLDGMTPVR